MTDRTNHCTGCKERQDRIEALTAENERLREICSLLDKALLAAFPYGASGEAWVLWNDARKALTRKETAETFTRSDNV